MQLTKKVSKKPNSKISLNVTVNKEEVKKIREEVIKDFEYNTKLPGFRKGKVPRNILEVKFSKNIHDETVSTVMRDSINQIVKEEEYQPISHPSVVETDELNNGEDFSFKAEFDVMPEVELGEYKGITSERYIYEVKDDAIQKEIEGLRERFATLVPTGEPSLTGDYLVIDYEEYADDGKIKTKKKNQTVLIDNKDDNFGKELVGLKKGEDKDISLSQEYEEDGKSKTYNTSVHITVKDVKKKQLPELNDDFAKDISDTGSLEELEKKVRDGLEKEAAQLSEDRTKDELLKKLIQKSTIDLPETLINYEINRIISNIAFSYRIDLEKLQKDEKHYEEYREKARPAAINNTKQDLILDDIARREKIKADNKELDAEIKRVAKRSKKSFEALKKELEEKGTIENYKYRLKLRKSLDFIYETAKLDKKKRIKYTTDKTEEGK
jgi:trigger factor